jgi:hypothetical protein
VDKVLIAWVECDVRVIPSTFTGMPFAMMSGTHTSSPRAVPNPISESTVMKHKRHFEIDRTEVREAATIGAMIADMRRIVEILDSSVSAEEERTRFRDRADGRYPILARQFAERRDNLKVTIATLEARLTSDSMNVPAKIASAA